MLNKIYINTVHLKMKIRVDVLQFPQNKLAETSLKTPQRVEDYLWTHHILRNLIMCHWI